MQDLFGNVVGPPGISNIQRRVKYVLDNYPETRNSDSALLVMVWKLFYNMGSYLSEDSMDALEKFLSRPSVVSPETITRRRREIQYEHHESKADENVELYRRQRSKDGPPQ